MGLLRNCERIGKGAAFRARQFLLVDVYFDELT